MTEYHYPEPMGRIILLAMEEIIGSDDVDSVLEGSSLASFADEEMDTPSEKSFPFEVVAQLQESLEQVYGRRSGRGAALRVGRASFQHYLREYGSRLGLTEPAFRLLPLSSKIQRGVNVIAELFNKHTDQHVCVAQKDGKLLWIIERCPLCWERKANEPVCYWVVGLLQETLYWLSGGKIFHVEEISCVAHGDAACTLEIDLVPLA